MQYIVTLIQVKKKELAVAVQFDKIINNTKGDRVEVVYKTGL